MNQALFWGKIRGELQLPLSHHCLDVAMVFRTLANLPLVRQRLETAAGHAMSETQLDRLAVFSLLHDLGKANLGFQDKPFSKQGPKAGHIRELSCLFFETNLNGALAQALDIDTLAAWFDPSEAMESFLIAAWSHHGMPVRFDEGEKTGNYYLAKTRWWRSDGKRDPFAAIAQLMTTAHNAFPKAFERGASPLPATPRLQHRFAGLVMLADWLGSHEGFFPIDRKTLDPIGFSCNAAEHAVRAVGLLAAPFQINLAVRPGGFLERFSLKPRPLQALIDTLPFSKPKAHLLIAEAETGSGKTEAALAWFYRLFAAGKVDALYFALPTRVAARELYKRICDYLKIAFPDEAIRPSALLAVPGYAQIDNMPVGKMLPEDSVRWHDSSEQTWQERTWAAEHPKRFLAATVAVGTIDQALLSALQTRHAHLRSVCLDRSLLVVDEVHASDPYMRRLLTGLLAHHLGLGGYALLLSATLGARLRVELLNAAGPKALIPDFKAASTTPYPAITDFSGVLRPVTSFMSDIPKTVRFEIIPNLMQPDLLLPEIARALFAGAKVLVVLNTVDRVIRLQRVVEAFSEIDPDRLFRCNGVICPHHGRFFPADRELLDEAVTYRLGKGSPSGPLLLIGTQTLEQSLDIDADLLITDLCPADVLLQRVGRLHRHKRTRPRGLENPRCIVIVPEQGDLEALLDGQGNPSGAAKRAGLGSVYEDMRSLELTRRMLIEKPLVTIPQDNRSLVEGATHPEQLETLKGKCWQAHGQRVDGATLAQEISAHYAAAVYDHAFGEFVFNEMNAMARTRLGLDTLRVPLNEAVEGPFGRLLTEALIPGHLAPKEKTDEKVIVIACVDNMVSLRYGDRYYRYSRLGLERSDEPVA